MHILLAEGRPRVRFALQALLTRQQDNHVVREVVDSAALLAMVESSCPDLILLDWELPGCTPYELVPTLRRVCPEVAVVALSGRLSARREALDSGVDAFVSKGDPPERLLAAIDCCVDRDSDCR